MQRAEPDDKLWYASHHPDRLMTPPAGTRPAAQYSRNKATLGSFLKNVTRPEAPDDKTVSDWLDDLMNQQAETRMSVALDMGGGDQVFKRFASSLELAELLAGEGIMPVAVHCLGPDVDSLAYLNDIEASRAFCPPSTILVLNEGLIRSYPLLRT